MDWQSAKQLRDKIAARQTSSVEATPVTVNGLGVISAVVVGCTSVYSRASAPTRVRPDIETVLPMPAVLVSKLPLTLVVWIDTSCPLCTPTKPAPAKLSVTVVFPS